MVDGDVGAEDARGLELGVGTAGHDGASAEMPRDLEGRDRHAAADAPDEHRLAWAERCPRGEHPPGRERRQRERRRLHPGHVRRHGSQVLRGQDHVFRGGPGAVLAEHAEARAGRFLAGSAGGAPAARDAGVDHDPVAGSNPLDGRADRLDDASAVRAHDVREAVSHTEQAVDDEEIEPVERRGVHPHADIAGRLDLGTGKLPQRQVVEPAHGVEREGLHRCAPLRTTDSALARPAGAE